MGSYVVFRDSEGEFRGWEYNFSISPSSGDLVSFDFIDNVTERRVLGTPKGENVKTPERNRRGSNDLRCIVNKLIMSCQSILTLCFSFAFDQRAFERCCLRTPIISIYSFQVILTAIER